MFDQLPVNPHHVETSPKIILRRHGRHVRLEHGWESRAKVYIPSKMNFAFFLKLLAVEKGKGGGGPRFHSKNTLPR